jgi:ATP-dependent helicase HrpB
MARAALPIDIVLPQLLQALREGPRALLIAPPGAGKTTRVAPALLDQGWVEGRQILLLVPRRLAARSAAEYMARERGEEAGATIGYATRLDTKIGKATRDRNDTRRVPVTAAGRSGAVGRGGSAVR